LVGHCSSSCLYVPCRHPWSSDRSSAFRSQPPISRSSGGATAVCALLLDFQVCVLDDLAPLCGLGLDVCGEVIRISRDYLQEARRQELLLKFSVREDLLYVGIDFPHHVARGLAGSEQSEPAHRLELRNAALRHRGHVRKLRQTP